MSLYQTLMTPTELFTVRNFFFSVNPGLNLYLIQLLHLDGYIDALEYAQIRVGPEGRSRNMQIECCKNRKKEICSNDTVIFIHIFQKEKDSGTIDTGKWQT